MLSENPNLSPIWVKIVRVAGGCILALLVLVICFAIILSINANWIKKPLGKMASASARRDIHINGDLRINFFSADPQVIVEDLTIGNPDWAPQEQSMAIVNKIDASFKLLSLFTGNIVMSNLTLERPNIVLMRQADGKANWIFSNGDQQSANENNSTKLPVIQHLIVNNGQLSVNDAIKKLDFAGTFQSLENTAPGQEFQLSGEGKLNDKPMNFNLAGPSLLNLQPKQPYVFNAYIKFNATEVRVNGTIPKPFDLDIFDAKLDLKGNDLADLYYLTGLALPNTPHYHVQGDLHHKGQEFHFSNFDGLLGGSDLTGDLKIEMGGRRPQIIADLKSKLLDFKDLGALFGGTAAGSNQINAKGEAITIAPRFLLPDAPLQVNRVRSMDAEVHYKAEAVNAPGLPLKQVLLDFYLDNAVLKFHPFALTLPQGRAEGIAQINAQADVPVVDVDVRLTNAHLEDFAGNIKPPPLEGEFSARAKLHGVGDSVHRAASTANGEITFVVPQGKMRRALAELMGINIDVGGSELLTGDESKTALRCGIADFKTQGGIMTAQTIVLDTGVVLTTGSGTVNLKNENLDVRLKGEPKEARLVRLRTPILVTGTLLKPSVGIDPAAAAAQTGVAAALGVFLTPIASILPFISPDLANDANCNALMKSAKTQGVPNVPTNITRPSKKD